MIVETIEEKPIDRDYNKHDGVRITHCEVLGGGIGYCLRAGHIMEVVIVEDEDDRDNRRHNQDKRSDS